MKLFLQLLFVSFVFISCSSEKSTSPQASLQEFKKSFSVNGNLVTRATNEQLRGYVTIDYNNSLNVNFTQGKLSGTSSETVEGFSTSFNNYEGIFRDFTDVTGVINENNQTINFTGSNIDGSSIAVTGTLSLLMGGDEDYALQWDQNHDKSAVVFRNWGQCTASITLGNETFNGITTGYWNTSNNCISDNPLLSRILIDVDNEESRILCSRMIGLNSNGTEFIEVDDCNTALFIVDKGISYEYSIVWENGITTTGTTGAILGGRQVIKCVGLSNPPCDGSDLQPGSANLFIDGVSAFSTIEYINAAGSECSSLNYKRLTFSSPNNAAFTINNIPQGTDSFNFSAAYTGNCSSQISGSHYNSSEFYFIDSSITNSNGIFTWTGPKSFTFTFNYIRNDGIQHTITGDGLVP